MQIIVEVMGFTTYTQCHGRTLISIHSFKQPAGGVYCDHSMRASGFRGESVRGASVLVVKTHKLTTQVQPLFSAAVVLVRNPREALVAEWQHRTIYNESEVYYAEHMHVWTANVNSHVLSLGKEYFGKNTIFVSGCMSWYV